MATINGVTFNLVNMYVTSMHRNEMTDQPGADENFITDMGYDGLMIRIEGYETSLATYDNVIAAFMASGARTLVFRTGWQYSVYSVQHTPDLLEGAVDNYFPYELTLYTSTPYRETTAQTTRSKTISSNNQTWTQDDSANDIDTSGNVDAVPDIAVTGGAVSSNFNRTSGYDGTNTDATEYTTTNTSYVLIQTHTYSAAAQKAYTLESTSMDLKSESGAYHIYGKVTYTAASLNGGAETTAVENYTNSTSYETHSDTGLDINAAGNEDLVIKVYQKTTNVTCTAYLDTTEIVVTIRRKDVCKNAQIYNTADETVVAQPGNEVDPDMVVTVNTDGTGSLVYADDFTDTKYLNAAWDLSGTTYDAGNDELDFGNSEYITYKIDTKYPITGIPVLTATVDIDSGTPTFKISTDDTTYYDIDTAIVDNVSTEYELDNAASLQLKGETLFYLKLNFDGSSTGSLVTFSLDIDTVTIDAEHPRITTGGSASTFQCDQHANSGLNCTVALVYRDRSFAG